LTTTQISPQAKRMTEPEQREVEEGEYDQQHKEVVVSEELYYFF
jgi:hypothetical protein